MAIANILSSPYTAQTKQPTTRSAPPKPRRPGPPLGTQSVPPPTRATRWTPALKPTPDTSIRITPTHPDQNPAGATAIRRPASNWTSPGASPPNKTKGKGKSVRIKIKEEESQDEMLSGSELTELDLCNDDSEGEMIRNIAWGTVKRKPPTRSAHPFETRTPKRKSPPPNLPKAIPTRKRAPPPEAPRGDSVPIMTARLPLPIPRQSSPPRMPTKGVPPASRSSPNPVTKRNRSSSPTRNASPGPSMPTKRKSPSPPDHHIPTNISSPPKPNASPGPSALSIAQRYVGVPVMPVMPLDRFVPPPAISRHLGLRPSPPSPPRYPLVDLSSPNPVDERDNEFLQSSSFAALADLDWSRISQGTSLFPEACDMIFVDFCNIRRPCTSYSP
jgi:hypothetical protein